MSAVLINIPMDKRCFTAVETRAVVVVMWLQLKDVNSVAILKSYGWD